MLFEYPKSSVKCVLAGRFFFAVLFSRLQIMAEIQNVIESSVAFHTVNARLPRQQASCHYLSSEG